MGDDIVKNALEKVGIREHYCSIRILCFDNGNDTFCFSNDDGIKITTIDEFINAEGRLFFHNSIEKHFNDEDFPCRNEDVHACVRIFGDAPCLSRIVLMPPGDKCVTIDNLKTMKNAMSWGEIGDKVVWLL